MELRDYLTILWRRKWVILITFLVTVAAVIAVTLRIAPVYTATTLLRISTYTGNSLDYTYANRLSNTYVKLATTKPVLDELKKQLGRADIPDIGVSIVPETELLQIKVMHQDPNLAAKIANTLAEILVSQSVELYTGSAGQSSMQILELQLKGMEEELDQAREEYINQAAQDPDNADAIEIARQSFELKQEIYARLLDKYEQARTNAAVRENAIYIVDPAIPPESPSNVNIIRNALLGCIVGLMGGVGLSFLFDSLDTTLYSSDQIEKLTNLPLIGTIPNAAYQEQLTSLNGNSPYFDAFRRLRSCLFTFHKDLNPKSLLVTSPEPGEGKSTIVTNLAYAIAQAGRTVVVIDCDLRRPSLHKTFKVPNEQGLSSLLLENIEIEEVLQSCSVPGIKIISSGPLPTSFDAAELLCSQHMFHLLNQLSQSNDVVLLDSPAMLSVSDSTTLAPLVDGVILVVSRANTRQEGVLSACKQLSTIKARTLGIVINRSGKNHRHHYYQSI